MGDGSNGNAHNRRLLTGWQAIAAHFGRNQSTVRRWASSAGLPVHRAAGSKGVAVYAYNDELDAWLTRARATDPNQPATSDTGGKGVSLPPRHPGRRRALLWMVPAFALALVGGASAVHLIGGGDTPAGRVEAPDEAVELYLRGTYLWNRRTPEGIARAINLLTRATELHPDYAEAYAGLAMAHNLARQYSGMSGWEAYPKAEVAARRAIELNPALDLAQGALAFIEFHWHWRVEDGLARFSEAIRLNPESANLHMWFASALLLAGRPGEALPVAARAQALDPHNSAVLNIMAQAYFFSDDVELALELISTTIEADPSYAWSFSFLSNIALSQGNYPAYLENYARLGDLIGVPRYRDAAEAGLLALAEGGAEAMAMSMLSIEQAYYERGEALAWDLARHHALLGHGDDAMVWLNISLNRREERLIGIKVDPAFWPIQSHPRYDELLARIGFPTGGARL